MQHSTTRHIPVLLTEAMAALRPKAGGVYVDGTFGGGGHSAAILNVAGTKVIAIDRDVRALERGKERLADAGDRVRFVRGSFADMEDLVHGAGERSADGILLDLGLSSDQLDEPERGFSFMADGPLDMRMSGEGMTAGELLETYPQKDLEHILRDYGDERNARRIAAAIVREREQGAIETTGQLADLVLRAYRGLPKPKRVHVATKTFQALRIAVNDEFGAIRSAIPQAIGLLSPGGRLAVITFHSGEDRLVKQLLRDAAKGCICPPRAPRCICGKTPLIRIVQSKAIVPGESEITSNPRSRSAQLRIAEKI